MTTLHDRLAELADDAPPGTPAADLWVRGRRYHRLRFAGTVAVVAAASVAIALVVGVSWQRSAAPVPQPAGSPAGLPDYVWQPSEWLPGTDEEGPLGQLAAVVPGTHGSWTGTTFGLFGISATTGEYRYLDLPDFPDQGWALSPDGRHVAYWTVGETSSAPNGDDPVTGFAVYDATTGETDRREIATEHGLSAETLAWADDERLVLGFGQWHDGGDGGGLAIDNWLWSWTLGADAPARVDTGPDDTTYASVAGDGKLVVDAGGGFGLIDLDDPGELTRIRLSVEDNVASYPVVDATGAQLAGIWGGSNPDRASVPNKVKTGMVPPGGGLVGLALVPGSDRILEIERWIGKGELAVTRMVAGDGEHMTLDRLDVRSGATVQLSAYEYNQPTFATDLLTEPTFDAQEPPDPADPRWVAGLVAGTVLLGGGMLVLWRRRVRP